MRKCERGWEADNNFGSHQKSQNFGQTARPTKMKFNTIIAK